MDDERARNKAVIEAHGRALDAGDADGFAAAHAEGGVNHGGRRVDFHHAQRFRLRDGLIVQHWAVRDDLRAMVQAGVVTPPGPPR